MSRPAREESGAQLLVRLSSRPELSSIDPHIFGWRHTTPSSSADSSSSSSHVVYSKSKTKASAASVAGHLVEIYGPEGVGKTELALYYVARTCLPHSWHGVHIGGICAKAVVVDTEVKFSVLRLAVIMEKQILALIRDGNNPNRDSVSPGPESELDGSESSRTLLDAEWDKIKTEQKNAQCPQTSEQTDSAQAKGWRDQGFKVQAQSSNSFSSGSYTQSKLNVLEKSDVQPDTNSSVKDEQSHSDASEEVKVEENHPDSLTPEDMESIVHESLERVQIVKPCSSQQLYMTLLSLEQALTCDLQATLLLLDSVSSFFWEDRLAEGAGHTARLKSTAAAAAGGMALVASIVSRLVKELGMTVITTKAPLLGHLSASTTTGRKRKWRGDKEEADARKNMASLNSSDASASCPVENGPEDDHVDFLGKAWTNLNPTRIMLTEENSSDFYRSTTSVDSTSGDGRENSNSNIHRVTTASCSVWPRKRRFSFVDDALQFL